MGSRGKVTGWRAALSVSALVSMAAITQASAQSQLSVEQLLTEGWEIAGYGALSFEGRSIVLFKHRDRNYLVQCSILYDVTRAKRVVTNCYEVR